MSGIVETSTTHTHESLTSAHLTPWLGNIVDLTMIDGTHRFGLLKTVDAQWAQLRRTNESATLVNDGKVRVKRTISIARAGRN
jgi:hypothetical protein